MRLPFVLYERGLLRVKPSSPPFPIPVFMVPWCWPWCRNIVILEDIQTELSESVDTL